jgi:hypothetical protein
MMEKEDKGFMVFNIAVYFCLLLTSQMWTHQSLAGRSTDFSIGNHVTPRLGLPHY